MPCGVANDIPLNGITMRILLPVISVVALQFGNTLENSANAAGLDLALSNETANLEYFMPLNNLIEQGSQLSLGLFYNQHDDVVGHAKLMAVGTQANTRVPYRLSVGAKAYAGEVNNLIGDVNVSVGAVAIGGAIEIQYANGFNPIDLTIEGYFTPGITTFGDTESITDIAARLSVEIVPQARAFVGYRKAIVEDKDNETWTLDDNIHFGIRLQF